MTTQNAPETDHLTTTVLASAEALAHEATLVDSYGNLTPITGEVYESSVMDGMVGLETDLGTLFIEEGYAVQVPTAHATVLEHPVTPARLKQVYSTGDDSTVVVTLAVDLDTLIEGDIETLNDLADQRILGSHSHVSLMDLTYTVTGHRGSDVLITVTADASQVFDEHLCVNFDECGGTLDDAEGYDGECGDCADQSEKDED
jgi:hypothetical protein